MSTIMERMRASGITKDPHSRFVESMEDQVTKPAYLREMKSFKEWIGESYEDLYDLGCQAIISTDPSNRLIILDKMAEYMEWVKKTKVDERTGRPLGYGKMRNIRNAIIKFYSTNGINFKVDVGHKLSKLTKKIKTKHRIPTKEELRNLINECKLRIKVAVALSKDSGLRVSDIVKIRYKDIKDGLSSTDGFYGFNLITEKTDELAMPCFGFETTKYLKLWVEELEGHLGRALVDDDYIFTHIIGKYKWVTQLSANGLDTEINARIRKLGLARQISATGLRYHFETNLELTELNQNLIKKIQGKGIPDSTGFYSKPDIDKVLNKYKPVYGALCVESDIEELIREKESR